MAGPGLGAQIVHDPMLTAQTGIIATATAGQLVIAKKQAKLAELSGEIQALTARINSEMQAFELDQGVINKETEAFFEGLNLKVDTVTKEYIDRFTESNVMMQRAETESAGIMSDLKVDALRKKKSNIIRNTGFKVSDLNRAKKGVEGTAVTSFAANNVGVSSLTKQAVFRNIEMETDRAVSRELLAAGDATGVTNFEIINALAQGVDIKVQGAKSEAEIEKLGAEAIFGITQKMINSESRISALASEATNLKLTSKLVRDSGVASANAAIAAGALNASTQALAGGLGALSTLSSGFSGLYQTYASKQQLQLAQSKAAATATSSSLSAPKNSPSAYQSLRTAQTET